MVLQYFFKKEQNDQLGLEGIGQDFNTNLLTLLSVEWHGTDCGRKSVEMCGKCRVLQGSEFRVPRKS